MPVKTVKKATKKKSVCNLFSAPKKLRVEKPILGPTWGVKRHQLPEHAPRKV